MTRDFLTYHIVVIPQTVSHIKTRSYLLNTTEDLFAMCEAVSYLNNAAIAYIQKGHHDIAIKMLTSAIDKLLRKISHDPVDDAVETEQMACDVDQSSSPKPLHRVDIGDSFQINQDSSMYCRALLLPKDQQCSSDSDFKRTSAVLLYNLALVHHWRGLATGKTFGLAKALKLYNMAMVVVQQNVDGIDMNYMAMAIFYNMGHIHAHLFQQREAHICFDSLRQILSQASDIHDVIAEDDYAVFFISAMFQESELHFAPAA